MTAKIPLWLRIIRYFDKAVNKHIFTGELRTCLEASSTLCCTLALVGHFIMQYFYDFDDACKFVSLCDLQLTRGSLLCSARWLPPRLVTRVPLSFHSSFSLSLSLCHFSFRSSVETLSIARNVRQIPSVVNAANWTLFVPASILKSFHSKMKFTPVVSQMVVVPPFSMRNGKDLACPGFPRSFVRGTIRGLSVPFLKHCAAVEISPANSTKAGSLRRLSL